MKIKCLSCGHELDMKDACDNYEGLVKCSICGSMLKVKTEEGKIYSITLMNGSTRYLPEEAFDSTLRLTRTRDRRH